MLMPPPACNPSCLYRAGGSSLSRQQSPQTFLTNLRKSHFYAEGQVLLCLH
ncbi:hypothetical protein E2C01_092649 [Portunus trituberculatus]|uniref:Uncharacterized protein n=1 Tax=Portunus trituberculatus TaxID=210409 RepID=A0A5B7JWF6_PORTR|nr:hypothetical protein [Portunus trituberculatus]